MIVLGVANVGHGKVRGMDQFLNLFFFVFHSLLTLFNLLGWIWKKTRVFNLVTLILTGFSWFVLGIWKGVGYCPCTDWHYQIRYRLGDTDMPSSYITFVLEKVTGLHFNAQMVDISVFLAFAFALSISSYLNLKDRKKKR